ncbi:MAG: NUDIX domain-containing protein [Bacteroidia bacterium]
MKFCPNCGKPLTSGHRAGKDRLVCSDSSCDFVFWDNPTPVVCAIVERAGKLILVQSIGWPDTWFALVTGFLEAHELPEDAVLREVKEETGLDATIGSFVGIYPFFRRNQLLLVYHVIAEAGPVILDKTELTAYKEVPISEVRPWPAGTGVALRDWLKSRGFEREFIPFP